jgi:5'-phosphate synthase pdxT subunit
MKAGVLALQGAFREHREVLDALGVEAVEVRVPEHLGGIDALFVPGGESTTIGKLLDTSGLREPLHAALTGGLPVLGTCAGLILLADDVRDGTEPAPTALSVLDCTVVRNAYGRQRESFEAPLAVHGLAGEFPGVFIRAPVVQRVGDNVEVLAEHEGHPVLVRQGAVWAATFHPELSDDLRLHERFLTEGTATTVALPTVGAEPELATAPKEKK